jgi:hypothetical protein
MAKAKAKAKKKSPARKKAVAKKRVPAKRAIAKSAPRRKVAKKPILRTASVSANTVSIGNQSAQKTDFASILSVETPVSAPASKDKLNLWGKKIKKDPKLNEVISTSLSISNTPTPTSTTATETKKPVPVVAKNPDPAVPKSKEVAVLGAKSTSRKKVTGNPELAEKIRSWGKKRRLTKDAYLAGLADAIEKDEDLVVWASTDVLAVFPHSYAAQTPNRLLSLMVLVRNVLVFAPVALTWLAISEATSAFAIYTTKETGTVANFLQFWEDGYGYLDDKWTISHVAVLDFQLVLAVIILTLVTEIISNRTEDRAEKDDLDSERERIGLAVEVMAYLFDKRGVNSVTMNSALARSVQNLRTSSKSLNDAAKRIEKVAKSLPNNATIIQEIRKVGK